MSSIELELPGLWIEDNDRDVAFQWQLSIQLVQTLFDEARVSLEWYEQSWNVSSKCVVPDRETAARRQVAAKAFVYSLDSIGKVLARLRAQSPPDTVREQITKYCDAFGTLKHIRDSATHLEDRARGVDKNGNAIETSILVLGSFANDDYTFTGSDGKRYSVAVSQETLAKAREILMALIGGFQWS